MGDAGFEAAGAEGTADINIVSGSNLYPAEFSDFHLLIRRRVKDQSICAGPCLHKKNLNCKFYRGWKPFAHICIAIVGAASSREQSRACHSADLKPADSAASN
jgi:hypothetical protein